MLRTYNKRIINKIQKAHGIVEKIMMDIEMNSFASHKFILYSFYSYVNAQKKAMMKEMWALIPDWDRSQHCANEHTICKSNEKEKDEMEIRFKAKPFGVDLNEICKLINICLFFHWIKHVHMSTATWYICWICDTSEDTSGMDKNELIDYHMSSPPSFIHSWWFLIRVFHFFF